MRREGRNWAALATLLSVLACYGTLIAIALLGALGVAVTLHEGLWAGAIVLFAWAAVLALGLRWRHHRVAWVPALAVTGAALISLAMLVQYSRAAELAGFALLCAALLADWRRR